MFHLVRCQWQENEVQQQMSMFIGWPAESVAEKQASEDGSIIENDLNSFYFYPNFLKSVTCLSKVYFFQKKLRLMA